LFNYWTSNFGTPLYDRSGRDLLISREIFQRKDGGDRTSLSRDIFGVKMRPWSGGRLLFKREWRRRAPLSAALLFPRLSNIGQQFIPGWPIIVDIREEIQSES
jgi:hypothetical protein